MPDIMKALVSQAIQLQHRHHPAQAGDYSADQRSPIMLLVCDAPLVPILQVNAAPGKLSNRIYPVCMV